jgi:hypothetical protein
MAGDAFGEAEATEETERTRQLLLAVKAFLFDRVERRRSELDHRALGPSLTLILRDVFR